MSAGACSGGHDGAPGGAGGKVAPPTRFETWTETFVDRTRPAVPASGPPQPQRTLVTTLYRPAGSGPFPLVLFAHGSGGHPDRFTRLFSAWAAAGFAVAAPAFPLTNAYVPGHDANVGDVTNQPADLELVLDNVVALGRQRGSRLFGAIDDRRIGAAGLSLGGIATYVLAFGKAADPRVKAVEILDGVRPIDLALDGRVPLLIAHSDADPTLAYPAARATYEAAAPPVWLLTLHGAPHSAQWEDTPTAYDGIAEHATLDFWQATLGRDASAFDRLRSDGTVPGLASIEAKEGGGPSPSGATR